MSPAARTWSLLCAVDVLPLVSWLQSGAVRWPKFVRGQPQRLPAPEAASTVITAVLSCFGGTDTYNRPYACVSRVGPGNGHGYHRDSQPPEWITRVHVPLVTNEACWFAWEPDGKRVHFSVGNAYSFNTLVPHAFGNDGTTERIHLTFDVLSCTSPGPLPMVG